MTPGGIAAVISGSGWQVRQLPAIPPYYTSKIVLFYTVGPVPTMVRGFLGDSFDNCRRPPGYLCYPDRPDGNDDSEIMPGIPAGAWSVLSLLGGPEIILEKVPALHLPEFTDCKPSYSRSVRVFPGFRVIHHLWRKKALFL